MRIWIEASLVALHGGGGSRRYAERLASGLRAAGEDVTVVAAEGGGGFGAPTRSLRLPPRLAGAAWAAVPWPPLTTLVGGPRPDLVHAAEKVSVPPVPRGVRLAVSVHDLWCVTRPDRCRGRLGFLVRRAWRTRGRWDLILTGTEATREELVSLGLPAERIAVTPYGLSEAFLAPDASGLRTPAGELGVPTPNVVFVGPLTYKKGSDVLLRAVAELRRRGSDVTLLVRGPDDLSEMEGELGAETVREVRGALRFLPPLEDRLLAALYAQAAAVVCPSRAEGYHFPLAEALAVGAAVVASDIPVFRETAQGAATHVPVGDAGALADGIEAAVEGRIARGGAFTPHRWERTVEGTLAAYRSVVRD